MIAHRIGTWAAISHSSLVKWSIFAVTRPHGSTTIDSPLLAWRTRAWSRFQTPCTSPCARGSGRSGGIQAWERRGYPYHFALFVRRSPYGRHHCRCWPKGCQMEYQPHAELHRPPDPFKPSRTDGVLQSKHSEQRFSVAIPPRTSSSDSALIHTIHAAPFRTDGVLHSKHSEQHFCGAIPPRRKRNPAAL